MSGEVKGGVLVAVAAFFWGVSGTVIKILFNQNLDPFRLVNMRLNLSFLILFAYFLLMDRSVIKIKRADMLNFAILGIFGITGVQSAYYYTVSALNVSMAIFLQFLAPILVAAYCALFQREKLGASKLAALAFALAGSFFIIFGRAKVAVPLNVTGLISGFASAVFCAFYYIYSKKCTDRYNSWTVLLYCLGAGAVFYWFISPPWRVWSGIGLTQLGFVVYITIFATILPFGFYLWGLRYLSPTTGSIIAMLEPVVASVSAYLVLGELMSLLQGLGGALVIAAVILIQTEKKHFVQGAAAEFGASLSRDQGN